MAFVKDELPKKDRQSWMKGLCENPESKNDSLDARTRPGKPTRKRLANDAR